jgi:hypothetical protein
MKKNLSLLAAAAALQCAFAPAAIALSPKLDTNGFPVMVRQQNPAKPNSPLHAYQAASRGVLGGTINFSESKFNVYKPGKLFNGASARDPELGENFFCGNDDRMPKPKLGNGNGFAGNTFLQTTQANAKNDVSPAMWQLAINTKRQSEPSSVDRDPFVSVGVDKKPQEQAESKPRAPASEAKPKKFVEEYKLKDNTTFRTETHPSGRVDGYQYKGDPVGASERFPKPHTHSLSSGDGTQHVYRTSKGETVHNTGKHIDRASKTEASAKPTTRASGGGSGGTRLATEPSRAGMGFGGGGGGQPNTKH